MYRFPLLLALAAAPLGAQSATEDLAMMREEQAFGAFATEFLAAAAAGDSARVVRMLSPKLQAQAGAAQVAQVVRGKVLPFFAERPEPAGASTVTRTTTGFGDRGFAYYRYAARRGGADARPFVLYVVREGEALVVANVVVDHHVEGRHR